MTEVVVPEVPPLAGVPDDFVGVSTARLDALEHLAYHAGSLLGDDGTSTVSIGALAEDVNAVCVTSSVRCEANGPRLVSTAADLRALGEAVRDGEPGAAPNGIPAVTLVEEPNGRPWQMAAVVSGGECEVFMAPMQEIWERQTVVPFWATDRVTDDGIAGHGPWRVVWHRGVELP